MAVVSLRGWEQQAAVFPRNRCSLNSLPGEMARKAIFGAKGSSGSRGRQQRSIGEKQADIRGRNRGFDPGAKFPPGRLIWLNSLYRPALPERSLRETSPAA